MCPKILILFEVNGFTSVLSGHLLSQCNFVFEGSEKFYHTNRVLSFSLIVIATPHRLYYTKLQHFFRSYALLDNFDNFCPVFFFFFFLFYRFSSYFIFFYCRCCCCCCILHKLFSRWKSWHTFPRKILDLARPYASWHMVPKWRRFNADATSSRHIDVNMTSFYVICPLE